MKVLLVIPPLVQINTPYPATSFLTGFLRSRGYQADQRDMGLRLILKLFSIDGLTQVLEQIQKKPKSDHPSVRFFLSASDDYLRTIEPTINFLQGNDPAIAHRLAMRTLLPEGPRFQALEDDDLHWAFGALGVQDQAKHIASLYIDDLVDVLQAGIDERFSLSRYGEKLAASQPSFDPLYQALNGSGGSKTNDPKLSNTLIDQFLREIVREELESLKPDVLALSVPFPGCVLGALKIAKFAREADPKIKILLGGGYVNTELRSLKDARLFEFVDAVTLDDGERPIECLLEHFSGKRPREKLFRTFLRSERVSTAVEFCNDLNEHDIPQSETGNPTVDGLPIHEYISMVEMLNPMHRFWSDLHWNKLMLAHGCYWHKCSFCDVNLDYIKRYEVSPTQITIDRMKQLAKESKSSGFHFVDEAAPPAVLRDLSKNLIEQKLSFSWWGNIRFEKTFDQGLTELMADAGCVAISGGLEVASDRLLKLMQKGVTVEQVARVTKNFKDSRILVHAYLMFGFPTETLQETVDSLERVRQLFLHGCLTSAFWHRFSATAHSPIGHAPKDFGIEIKRDPHLTFAENDLQFFDSVTIKEKIDLDAIGFGLKKAVYNYMLGIGLDQDVREWFEVKVPKTTVNPRLILDAIK